MGEERFEFHQLPRDVESAVRAQAKDTAELFEKWCENSNSGAVKNTSILTDHRGLSGRMKFATFLYNSHFQSYQKDSFTLVQEVNVCIGHYCYILAGFLPKPRSKLCFNSEC